jgi:hypothetical protein
MGAATASLAFQTTHTGGLVGGGVGLTGGPPEAADEALDLLVFALQELAEQLGAVVEGVLARIFLCTARSAAESSFTSRVCTRLWNVFLTGSSVRICSFGSP